MCQYFKYTSFKIQTACQVHEYHSAYMLVWSIAIYKYSFQMDDVVGEFDYNETFRNLENYENRYINVWKIEKFDK